MNKTEQVFKKFMGRIKEAEKFIDKLREWMKLYFLTDVLEEGTVLIIKTVQNEKIAIVSRNKNEKKRIYDIEVPKEENTAFEPNESRGKIWNKKNLKINSIKSILNNEDVYIVKSNKDELFLSGVWKKDILWNDSKGGFLIKRSVLDEKKS